MPPRSNRPAPEPSQHSILLTLARQAKLVLTPEGQAHAIIPRTNNTVPLANPLFTDWLFHIFYQNGHCASFAQIGAIRRQLEIDAHATATPIAVQVRTAASPSHTGHLDLANPANEAIQINAKRWSTTQKAPRFHRPTCNLPIQAPERTKVPIQQLLQRTFNIGKPEAQTLTTWLISAMLPGTKPPALVITGKAARESAATLRNIIDPVRCPFNILPTTQNQCGRMAQINYLPTFAITSITKKGLANLNRVRTGIDVKLRQVSKLRKPLTTKIHRPILIAASKPLTIHEGQWNIEINEAINAPSAQLLAALLQAVVRTFRKMRRAERPKYFTANSVIHTQQAEPDPQPDPPHT